MLALCCAWMHVYIAQPIVNFALLAMEAAGMARMKVMKGTSAMPSPMPGSDDAP
jgi:hypothetical protein